MFSIILFSCSPTARKPNSHTARTRIIAALRSPWPTTSAAAEPSPDGTHLIFKAAAFASFGWEDLWAVAPWLKEELAGKTGGGIGYLREGE